MRTITKVREPSVFRTYKSIPGASFDNMPTIVKNNLRESLLRSQGYICCYCMRRINRASKIEHFRSQNHYNGLNGTRDLRLSYDNLFAACADSGGRYENQTCDSHKKDLELRRIDLTSPMCDTMFKYNGNGTISSISDDEVVNDDINTILNLNHQSLMEQRKRIYTGVVQRIHKYHKKGTLSIGILTKELSYWNSLDNNGFYKEYFMVATYCITKHIKKLKANNP